MEEWKKEYVSGLFVDNQTESKSGIKISINIEQLQEYLKQFKGQKTVTIYLGESQKGNKYFYRWINTVRTKSPTNVKIETSKTTKKLKKESSGDDLPF